jgi:hypothetical protein
VTTDLDRAVKLAIWTAVLVALSTWVPVNLPTSASLTIQATGGLLALITGGGAFMYLFNWIAHEWVRRLEEYRRAQAITPHLELVRVIQRMTPEQVKLVPPFNEREQLAITTTPDGPVFALVTSSGTVPLEFVEDFLRDCGVTSLRPVREYQEGTPAREFAQMVTEWAVAHKFAVPAVGPHPARWINEHARGRAAAAIGISLEAV